MLIKAPRGTQDILPEQWPAWNFVIDAARQTAEERGFGRIDTPTFEATSLFTHATGEHTDVNREMYTFQDRRGDDLSLRPEGTASVFRAYFQHGMQVKAQPIKLYYIGSMFRYERPQAGRVREHHQFGCEAIGSEDPLVDASMVELLAAFYQRAGLSDLSIHVNSIGDEQCRPAYIRDLVAYLRQHADRLCGQCRDRMERNPLRVLDCKVESCQPVLNEAPKILDRLCEPCRVHWQRFLAGLDLLEIRCTIDPRLVRGLDYYTRTVFEFMPSVVTGATSTVGAGGRYDALAAAIDAPPTPGVGFSTGLERVLLHVDPKIIEGLGSSSIDVFVVHMGAEAELAALRTVKALLEAGISAEMAYGDRAIKTQLKQANGRGAKVAVIIGEDEVARGVATVRSLQTGDQEQPGMDQLTQFVTGSLESERVEAVPT